MHPSGKAAADILPLKAAYATAVVTGVAFVARSFCGTTVGEGAHLGSNRVNRFAVSRHLLVTGSRKRAEPFTR